MFAERLKELRKMRRFSQHALAERLGISQQAVGKWETGKSTPDPATLREIERRKMWFDIEVHDEKGKCGEGSHLRIMVPQKDRSQG